ncbi:MAG: hypothetical protein ACRC33_27535 [Gemmataceae bacterium]
MKGFMRAAAVMAGCALGLTTGCTTLPTNGCNGAACGAAGCGAGGCAAPTGSCKDLYDPCWPERYNTLARRSVNHAMAPQVMNGHVLDQTIWNYHFETATDKLTEGGLAHLQYVSRRRPCPDKTVYLATALDLRYDPACPDRYAGARQELDTLRVAAVQKYLTALNSGRPQEFDIKLHDPADPSLRSNGPSGSVLQMYGRFRGGLPTQGGDRLTTGN